MSDSEQTLLEKADQVLKTTLGLVASKAELDIAQSEVLARLESFGVDISHLSEKGFSFKEVEDGEETFYPFSIYLNTKNISSDQVDHLDNKLSLLMDKYNRMTSFFEEYCAELVRNCQTYEELDNFKSSKPIMKFEERSKKPISRSLNLSGKIIEVREKYFDSISAGEFNKWLLSIYVDDPKSDNSITAPLGVQSELKAAITLKLDNIDKGIVIEFDEDMSLDQLVMLLISIDDISADRIKFKNEVEVPFARVNHEEKNIEFHQYANFQLRRIMGLTGALTMLCFDLVTLLDNNLVGGSDFSSEISLAINFLIGISSVYLNYINTHKYNDFRTAKKDILLHESMHMVSNENQPNNRGIIKRGFRRLVKV